MSLLATYCAISGVISRRRISLLLKAVPLEDCGNDGLFAGVGVGFTVTLGVGVGVGEGLALI